MQARFSDGYLNTCSSIASCEYSLVGEVVVMCQEKVAAETSTEFQHVLIQKKSQKCTFG